MSQNLAMRPDLVKDDFVRNKLKDSQPALKHANVRSGVRRRQWAKKTDLGNCCACQIVAMTRQHAKRCMTCAPAVRRLSASPAAASTVAAQETQNANPSRSEEETIAYLLDAQIPAAHVGAAGHPKCMIKLRMHVLDPPREKQAPEISIPGFEQTVPMLRLLKYEKARTRSS